MYRDCTSIIHRLHQKFFLENLSKTSCIKRTFFKNFIVWQYFSSFPWRKLLFSKNAGLEFVSAISLKKGIHHRDYLAWVLQGNIFLIIREIFCQVSMLTFLLHTGAQIGIFWKVTQSLKKCRPPWLALE